MRDARCKWSDKGNPNKTIVWFVVSLFEIKVNGIVHHITNLRNRPHVGNDLVSTVLTRFVLQIELTSFE